MLRLLFAFALCLAGGALPAVAQSSDASRALLVEAARADEFTLRASEAALERGGDALQPLANLLLADHATLTERLAELAAEHGVDLPADLDAGQQQQLDRLATVPASEFDLLFLTQQQAAHAGAVALFAGYASEGDDPALRAFAAEVLPMLNAHLDDIETLLAAR